MGWRKTFRSDFSNQTKDRNQRVEIQTFSSLFFHPHTDWSLSSLFHFKRTSFKFSFVWKVLSRAREGRSRAWASGKSQFIHFSMGFNSNNMRRSTSNKNNNIAAHDVAWRRAGLEKSFEKLTRLSRIRAGGVFFLFCLDVVRARNGNYFWAFFLYSSVSFDHFSSSINDPELKTKLIPFHIISHSSGTLFFAALSS